MTVKYDLYKTPLLEGGDGEESIHVRIVNTDLVTTDQLARDIEHAGSLTEGDVISTLSLLSHFMLDYLADGRRVHIKGLGYFKMVITHVPPATGEEIKGGHVQFKTIQFLPEKSVKQQLKKTRFLRSDRGNVISKSYTDAELKMALKEYFETESYISRKKMEALLYLTRSTAISRINQLIEEGMLKKEGIAKFPIYMPTEKLKNYKSE